MPHPTIPPETSEAELWAPVGAPRRRSDSRRNGAWKVAYADFVTALMALFIVLWMMNATERVKKSVSGYFLDPRGYTRKLGAGPGHSGEGIQVKTSTVAEVRQQIEAALRRMPDFERLRQNVQFSVTGEGLRIDLLETEQGLFFPNGSTQPTAAGQRLLASLAAEMGRLPNRLVIEGHTDARQFRDADADSGYGNWELSVERANVARRILHSHGVRPEQIVEVRGFADQHLLRPGAPEDPANRRVSVVVKFVLEGSGEQESMKK
jgi:chemotaxis protein MotB